LFARHHLDSQRVKDDMRLNMSSLVRFDRGPEKTTDELLVQHCFVKITH